MKWPLPSTAAASRPFSWYIIGRFPAHFPPGLSGPTTVVGTQHLSVIAAYMYAVRYAHGLL